MASHVRSQAMDAARREQAAVVARAMALLRARTGRLHSAAACSRLPLLARTQLNALVTGTEAWPAAPQPPPRA